MSENKKLPTVKDVTAHVWNWLGTGKYAALLSSAPSRPCILGASRKDGLVTSVNGRLQSIDTESLNMRLLAAGPSMCRVLKEVYVELEQVQNSGAEHLSTEAANSLSHLQNIIVQIS